MIISRVNWLLSLPRVSTPNLVTLADYLHNVMTLNIHAVPYIDPEQELAAPRLFTLGLRQGGRGGGTPRKIR